MQGHDAKLAYEICCGDTDRNVKWDRRFIQLAELVSTWSKDPSTGCGAVVVDRNHRVVSMGFNGLPQRIKDSDERLNDRDTKYSLTVHAEVNAIIFSNRSLIDCTIYVYPIVPCIRCAVQIIQSGITQVVSIPLSDEKAERWGKDAIQSIEIFKESGITYREI